MKTLAAAISAAVLAGPAMAQEARVYPLPDRAAYPEGVAVTPDGRTAYLSSPNTGIIFAVDLPTGDVREIGDPLGRDPNAPIMSVTLGVKLDGQGRLWFAGARTGGMHVVDSRSGDLIAAFTTPDEPALINDLAIAGDGVYFTDTLRPYLWRVPLDEPQGGALEPWLAFDGTALEYGEEPNLNGIAATADGGHLIVVQMNGGKLFRIDTDTREVIEIDTGGADLTGGDGLVLDGQRLYVVRQWDAEIVTLDMTADLTAAQVVKRTTHPGLAWPATAAIAGDNLVVANSQLNRRGDGNPELPFSIIAIPLSELE